MSRQIGLSAKKCRAKKDGPPGQAWGVTPCGWAGAQSIPANPTAARSRVATPPCAARLAAAHGSVAKRRRPVGLSVLASKVRISIAPPTSSVTAMRSSATAALMMRAPFGSSAVTSAGALPSALKTRWPTTPMPAAIGRSVVAPATSTSHRTFATMRAAAGSRGASSSAESLLMALQGRSETVVIAAEESGERLDRVLAHRVAELSRSRHKALILAGPVAIGRAPTRAPGHPVTAGATIVLDLPPAEDVAVEPENIPLDVVFEDADLIVIDKPAGLVVHPAAGNWTGTLVNALIAHCGESLSGIGGVKRPGLVHRPGQATSGWMVVAKPARAHRALSRQFADHGRSGALRRGYLAFVWGVPERPRGTIDKPIGRHPRVRDKMAVRADG